MSTFREVVYMVMDELKLSSDDSYLTEDHVLFLISKFRAFLLKQRYSTDIKKPVSESNFSTICLNLIEVPAISGEPCEGGVYLRSESKVPYMMRSSTPKVYPIDFFQGEITYVDRNRMKYVGYNRYLSNIIYCSLAPDNYLYFKSVNPQYLHLEKVRVTALFSDIEEVFGLQCDDEGKLCELMDAEFPLESALIPPLIELVVKELRGPEYSPQDKENNAEDDLSNVNTK